LRSRRNHAGRTEPAVGFGFESGGTGEDEFGGMSAIVTARRYYKNRVPGFLGSEPKFAKPAACPGGAVRCTAAKLVSDPNNLPFTASEWLALVSLLGKKRRLLTTVIVLETEKILTVQGAY
jgi:hypothetical protein